MKCPLTKKDCLKNKCAWWVQLVIDKEKEEKCAVAWLMVVLVEIRMAIEQKTK